MITRKLLRAMCETWKGELADAGATPERLAECQGLFEDIDHNLSGMSPTGTNNLLLQETMTSADFTNAIQTFVSRLAIPGYEQKVFAFEPLVWMDTLTNFLPHDRYQNRGSLDDLELVGEKGQARPGSVDDATARSYRVYRWEKQLTFPGRPFATTIWAILRTRPDKWVRPHAEPWKSSSPECTPTPYRSPDSPAWVHSTPRTDV